MYFLCLMVCFTAIIDKFGDKGEKTGWTYLHLPAHIAQEINPGVRVSFRVKGQLDSLDIAQVSVLPMGDGDFIMPVNIAMRRALHKNHGATVLVALEHDTSAVELSAELLTCLSFEPEANDFFEKITMGHRRYWSNWVESAKTIETKSKRISQAIYGLSNGMDYGATIRYFRDKNK
jgi:hypothetical protein